MLIVTLKPSISWRESSSTSPGNWFWQRTDTKWIQEQHWRIKSEQEKKYCTQMIFSNWNCMGMYSVQYPCQLMHHCDILFTKQMPKQQANHSDLCESHYADATCFSQFSKMLPYVPTVSNVISKSLEVHSFPTELSEPRRSANRMTENRLAGQKYLDAMRGATPENEMIKTELMKVELNW